MPATARPGPLTVLPSGEQFEIRADGQRATIVEVGGGLREYEVDNRPVIEPYSVDRMPTVPTERRSIHGRTGSLTAGTRSTARSTRCR